MGDTFLFFNPDHAILRIGLCSHADGIVTLLAIQKLRFLIFILVSDK